MDYWRAVYADPDTKRVVYERLDPVLDERARRDWAIRKSRALRKREADIATGAPKATGTTLKEGIDLWFTHACVDARKSTIDDYRAGTDLVYEWAAKERVEFDTLVRAKLLEFRTFAYNYPKRRRLTGGRRGEQQKLNGKRRANITINGDLRAVRMLLKWLRESDRLPLLLIEDLPVALKYFPEDEIVPQYLTPPELRELFDAAELHDAAVFKLTRAEKRNLGQRRDSAPGSTPKHVAVAPLVMAAVLSGSRLDELCLLDWRTHVFLDAQDFDGNVVGEYRLRAQDTKTHKPRTVSFDVSPLLRELFVALHRASGGKGSVFGVTYDQAQKACQLLKSDYGAPERFDYQTLRSTVSTYLSNAPGIYGSVADLHATKQLGHSQEVARKHYTGLVKGIPRDLRTLEAVTRIEDQCRAVIARVAASAPPDNVVKLRRV
jgi:hypothetical protein